MKYSTNLQGIPLPVMGSIQIIFHSNHFFFWWFDLYSNTLSDKVGESVLDNVKNGDMSKEQVLALTGFTTANITEISRLLTSIRSSSTRDVFQALVVFLFKLRTGTSDLTAALALQIKDHQKISDYFTAVTRAFEADILPYYFGPSSLSRDYLVECRTSPIARQLFNT